VRVRGIYQIIVVDVWWARHQQVVQSVHIAAIVVAGLTVALGSLGSLRLRWGLGMSLGVSLRGCLGEGLRLRVLLLQLHQALVAVLHFLVDGLDDADLGRMHATR
jgi:hypothetical protein